MAQPPKKTSGGTPPSGKTTATKRNPEEPVLPVTNPLDLWYLCEKANYAQEHPLRTREGFPMYQRTVTQEIRLDDRAFSYNFPYFGEVGFNMAAGPVPAPIMSLSEPHRPSDFPLSRYQVIKDDYILRQQSVVISDPLLSKDVLEAELSIKETSSGKGLRAVSPVVKDPFGVPNKKSIKGLIRIPDVIRVTDEFIYGAAKFAQANMAYVIEMKFGPDQLSKEQQKDYLIIAGDFNKFRLMETGVCRVADKTRRGWIRSAAREPVYVPVGKAMEASARRNRIRGAIPEYELLLDHIEAEHAAVRKLLEPPVATPGVPMMTDGTQAREAERQAEIQRQHTRDSVGLILGAPMAAATPVMPLAAMSGEAVVVTEGIAVTVTNSGKLVQFTRYVGALAANAAAYEAAASEHSERGSRPVSSPSFVYWPD